MEGMIFGRPHTIAINHDDYHAEHVGVTKSGFQFFLTTPFEPSSDWSKGCEYIALFKFDADGRLVGSRIEKLGSRGSYNQEERRHKYFSYLDELGEIKLCRIEVRPFSVEKYGVNFGLIVREPVNDNETWVVELLPGNYMAFFEPWDSGKYDT